MVIYVNVAVPRDGNGNKEMSLKHINTAAQIAEAGDEVIVAPGIYREYVDPKNDGTIDASFIKAKNRWAVITGAEEVKSWKNMRGMCGYAASTMVFSVPITRTLL